MHPVRWGCVRGECQKVQTIGGHRQGNEINTGKLENDLLNFLPPETSPYSLQFFALLLRTLKAFQFSIILY